MAKMTTLQLVNGVLRNLGESSSLASLTSLSGVQSVVWDKLVEALYEICADQNTRFQFLEKEGAIPLVTGSYKYLISGLTNGSDMQREDRESFVQPDSGMRIKYTTPQEWDRLYPSGITTSMTGYPDRYMKFNGYIYFNRQATASENGNSVNFRYWKHPTLPDTSTPNATLDIPEPFDRLVLLALATMKSFVYLGNDESLAYRIMIYGDNREIEGSFAKLHELYGSPEIKPRVSLNA